MEIYICTKCGDFKISKNSPQCCFRCKKKNTFKNRKKIVQDDKLSEFILSLCK